MSTCCTHSNVVNSGVTGPYPTIFLHNIEKLLTLNLLKWELWSCNRFLEGQYAEWRWSWPFLQIWPGNWLSWQRPLSNHKVNECLMKPSQSWKFDAGQSSGFWDYLARTLTIKNYKIKKNIKTYSPLGRQVELLNEQTLASIHPRHCRENSPSKFIFLPYRSL